MEVVSTSTLVSSKNEKRKKTTACNFQIMAVNSFVIPHDLMRADRPSHFTQKSGD